MKIILFLTFASLAWARPQRPQQRTQIAEVVKGSFNNRGMGSGASGDSVTSISDKSNTVSNAESQKRIDNIDASVVDSNAVDTSQTLNNQNGVQNLNRVDQGTVDYTGNFNGETNSDNNSNAADQVGLNGASQDLTDESYNYYSDYEENVVNFPAYYYNGRRF